MLKKTVVLIFLIFSICLTSFAKPNYTYTMPLNSGQSTDMYVNTEIKTPITQIGDNKPPEQTSTQTKPEIKTITKPVTTTTKKTTKTGLSAKSVLPSSYYVEQEDISGLEINWNQWHADVRNAISKFLCWRIYPFKKFNRPLNGILDFIYKIDANQNISDIVLVSFPRNMIIRNGQYVYYKANSDFYMYVYQTDKFYKLQLQEDLKHDVYNLTETINLSTITPIEAPKVPYYLLYKPFAERLQAFSGNKVLIFPKKTKRTFMVISQGFTNIEWLVSSSYLAKFFNDIERQ